MNRLFDVLKSAVSKTGRARALIPLDGFYKVAVPIDEIGIHLNFHGLFSGYTQASSGIVNPL